MRPGDPGDEYEFVLPAPGDAIFHPDVVWSWPGKMVDMGPEGDLRPAEILRAQVLDGGKSLKIRVRFK